MPSPFPGMDPCLEDPELFPGLHDRLIYELSAALQTTLGPRYCADISSRVWVEFTERIIELDVNVLETNGQRPAAGGSAVAVAVQPVVVPVPHEATQRLIQITTVHDDRRLVTAIEILSPTNKTTAGQGRANYLQKQREYMGGEVHLIEIDLLRGGTHTTAVPADRAGAAAGAFDYHVCVRRFNVLGQFFVYAIRVEDRLPSIHVPLLPGDTDLPLDLQAAFDRAYDTGPYRRLNPYATGALNPPLAGERTAWADDLVRRPGRRSSS